MGVPAFFRWLSRKYPSIIVHCVEEKAKSVNGDNIPVDSSQPNPNDVEFDNLYLDMNGIIHPCCHPEDKPAPRNEDEMMVAIFEYIDRIFSIVRPRRLLYMAIDGVAPRAKMNQQRSRRFRASKESVEKVAEVSRIREELDKRGAHLPPEKPKEEHFDSNCITPGTPFMARLAKCLDYYIHNRLNNDPGWKNIEVILSDANVPGEGEHKIMDYIRRQRGLATHEPNFTIIREEFKPNQPRPCDICGQIGHEMKDCAGLPKEKQGKHDELEKPFGAETQFIFLRLNVLREYLEKELTMTNLPFTFDLERAIDDWVFMCFFVGNDFLPHLPSLEIREGAIDRLVNLYKKTVYKTGGYLTKDGFVNLSRVQLIMTDLGEVEDEIFKSRQQRELAFKQRNKEKKKRMKLMNDKPAWIPQGQFAPVPIGSSPAPVQNARQEAYHMRIQGMHSSSHSSSSSLKKDSDSPQSGGVGGNHSRSSTGEKRKREDEGSDSSDEEPPDEVRLWEEGWKERYYESKFDVDPHNIEFRIKVAAAYTEGLCWVLQYYYQGCASWKWFFPYHYAPFASDFINIGDVPTSFEKGTKPFKPLEQLMGVFPAASKQHLPESWGKLMDDPESPIIDFYPDDFKIDLNGKKYAWQGVALLPFVDEKRLLDALSEVYGFLSVEENKRNVRGDDRLYVAKAHKGYDFFAGLYEGRNPKHKEFEITPLLFNGMKGTVLLSDSAIGPGETVHSVIVGQEEVQNNKAICVRFRDPSYPDNFIFPARRLKGAKDPSRVLKPGDLSHGDNRHWRPQIGMAPARQRASLGASGKRMLSHSMNNRQVGQGQYATVPPPNPTLNYGQFVPSTVSRSLPGAFMHNQYALLGLHSQQQGRISGDRWSYNISQRQGNQWTARDGGTWVPMPYRQLSNPPDWNNSSSTNSRYSSHQDRQYGSGRYQNYDSRRGTSSQQRYSWR
ncbi:5'-3' exoribonuclease 2 Rat1 isoform X3 [Tachypleus tridentatus]|uniref:5'-3' exoribonuclease 2 Rat1 isoform X3 n=1 Tax=Tachypleus tridentatus TaxID=6853 RepID=UPI003FCFDA57